MPTLIEDTGGTPVPLFLKKSVVNGQQSLGKMKRGFFLLFPNDQ